MTITRNLACPWTLAACFAFAAPLAAETPPNFVFIIADDCTYTDLECYGGQAKTPHMNRLVEEGLKFNRCYQAAPTCSPTRHNVYTALYPVKSGAHPNHTFVHPGTESIAHWLKNAGYRVALSGKKHINPPESFPFEFSGKGNNPDFAAIDRLFAACKKSETPFCLFACSNEPHTPWNKGDPSAYEPAELDLPPFYVDTPETRDNFSRYLAEVTYFDWQVGQCLDLLDRHGLNENTLVMVVSEQGNSFPFAKWTCYELGLASAMIVRWPGHIEPGSETHALVEYVDVAPTFLDAAGLDIPEGLDGRSFLPVLLGQTDEHSDYTYGIQTSRGIINGPERFAIRSVASKRYRYVWNIDADQKFSNVVMGPGNDWWQSWLRRAEAGDEHARKMVDAYRRRAEEELYDVIEDRYNLNNLADDPKYAEVKQHLRRRLLQWMESQGDNGRQTELQAESRQWRNFRQQRRSD